MIALNGTSGRGPVGVMMMAGQSFDAEGFAARLSALREAMGLSRKEVARRANMSLAGYTKLEAGQVRSPRFETIEGLAAAFGVPADMLGLSLHTQGEPDDEQTERENLVLRLVHTVPREELPTMMEFSLVMAQLTPTARRDMWHHLNLWFRANGIRAAIEPESIDWMSGIREPQFTNTNNHDHEIPRRKGEPGWQD